MKISDIPRIGSLLLIVGVAFLLPTVARAQDDISSAFPETTRGAIQTYEENVTPEEWIEGPVEYIILDYERDIWNSLDVAVEKEAFRDWFWMRRDPDPRDDEHEQMEAFYERVARANQRFNEFPRGWRSDRGRVWVTLGPPTGGMRPIQASNSGRCAARQAELWTYYTNNMSLNANFGEFYVYFIESRVGQFEICDPSMLGVGAYPTDLRRAMDIMTEAMVLDTVTEFDVSLDAARRSAGALPVREIEGGVEPLEVPIDSWGDAGVAGSVVVPILIPLRDLLFEPVGEELVATLDIEATLVGMGADAGQSGARQWRVRLDSSSGAAIGAASLRTAIVLPSEAGAFAARVRVTDPLSGQVRVWEGAVEVAADGAAASPPLVGRTLVQLRDAGEVAVIGGRPPEIEAGASFAAVSWVRGVAVDPDAVVLTLIDADNVETVVEADTIAWGNQGAAGPLVVEATLPDLASGRYVVRLDIGGGIDPVESVVEVR